MAANGFTIVTNFNAAKRMTGVSRHEMKEDSGGNNGECKVLLDELGVVAIIGRGETNKRITYIALKFDGTTPESDTFAYVFPNATGDGIEVTTVKP